MGQVTTDIIGTVIGDIGRWQIERIILNFLISIPGLAQIFTVVFATQKTDFWCADNVNVSDSRCECSDFQYNRTFWKDTLIMRWDMVCDKEYLTIVTRITIFLGFAVGTFGTGLISDRYGRRFAIHMMSQLLFAAGIMSTILPYYPLFLIAWFLTGVASIGVYTAAYVWSMEIVSGKWKPIVGMSMAFCWLIGRLLSVGLAWFLRDWKLLTQIMSSLHLVTPLLLYWLPESPRWLLASSGEEARTSCQNILRNILKRNGENNLDQISKVELTPKTESRYYMVLKSKILRKRSLVLHLNWFANSFILYGLSLNWKALTGNLFTNFLAAAGLEAISRSLCMVFLSKISRKKLYISSLSMVGLCFLINIGFDAANYLDDLPNVVLSLMGSFFITMSFPTIWIYTTELFPTNLRNAALGASSLSARVAGVFATLIGNLAEINPIIPKILFAVMAILGVLTTLLLPDTVNEDSLPNTIEECVAQGKPKTSQ